MNRRILGLAAIIVAVIAVVGFKQVIKPAPSSSAAAASTGKAETTVLLFADPREADESADACAQLFHLVRDAARRGVRTREIDPEHDHELTRQFRVRVVPTVLVMDARGREVSRHEGEGRSVIKAIKVELEQLAKAR